MKFIKRKKVIRKSNQLINAKESTPLTALERKLMLFSIAEVDNSGVVSFRIQDLYGTSQLNTSHYRNVRRAVENLLNVKVLVEEGNVSDKDWSIKGMNVFDVIEASKKGGNISAHFTQSIIPHIIDLKRNYTTYLYDSVSSFRSDFSIRIYELLVQGVGQYKKREFSVEELKEKLSLDTLKSYQNFNQLKTKVLEKACAEISEKSDLNVSWDILKKVGKKVTHIVFYMELKSKSKSTSESTLKVVSSPKEGKQQEVLSEMGLSEEQIKMILQMKGGDTAGSDNVETVEAIPVSNTNSGEQTSLFKSTEKVENRELADRKKRLITRLRNYNLDEILINQVVAKTQASKESGIWKILYDFNLQSKESYIKHPRLYLEKILKERFNIE